MKQADEAAATNGEVKAVMGEFCEIAKRVGASAAEKSATVHLIAAVAYLEETVGSIATKQILSATIAAIITVLN